MTTLDSADSSATGTFSHLDPEPGAGTGSPLRWWRELLYAAVFYGVYSIIRNTQGSAASTQQAVPGRCANQACHHATDIIAIERDFHVFHEQAIQHAFLGVHWLLQLMNVYYGTAHFIVTIAALVWLFRRDKARYPLWRNTLAATTALALVGFALFPLMPPRLLPEHYGFVDTLQRYGGSWSFDSGAMQRVSNQYAAMPSLHFGWSLWCTGVLFPACRRGWTKALVAIYPLLTLVVVVVTANHYFLDAVGGAAVFSAGYALCLAAARLLARHHPAVR